jgi:DNA polymerase I-like protein with 3'-5' exonuclease and polymerase domains
MVDIYEAGLTKVCPLHLQIHDELLFSVPKTKEGIDACIEIRELMAGAIKLDLPVHVDMDAGIDWGHCDTDIFEMLDAG